MDASIHPWRRCRTVSIRGVYGSSPRRWKAAHRHGKWVGYGELAANPQATPILVGMGVDELSVGVPAIPTIKTQIRSFSNAAAQALTQRALSCTTAAEVRALSFARIDAEPQAT
ncbi:MAG: hypothetical protein KIS63_07200 [Caldilineales bacterium]|nr:hypothetical protein [Caldilineales bacterium]